MQGEIEYNQRDENRVQKTFMEGMCVAVTLWITACCLRYQCGNPWLFADMMGRMINMHVKRGPPRERLRRNLALWARKMYVAKTWGTLASLVGLETVAVGPRSCMVWSDTRGGPCKRNPCPGHAMCAKHRFVCLNERWTTVRDCEEPIPWAERLGQPPQRTENPNPIEVD